VPDVKAVGLLIRAYLNNQPNGAAAALAVALVLEFLPPHATEIINASIGSGFAASSVKECAASLRRDRGTLRRHLRDVGDQVLTPRRVMDIVKAVYAITLLRGTGATIRSVSSAVGFTSKMSLPHLLDRSVGLSPKQARDQAGDRQVEERLHGLLTSCGLGSKARCPHVDSGRSE
jgi:AraC-like DNA-binding protein